LGIVKKGINIWSFPEGMPIAECVRLAAEAGFEGIELALNEDGELSLDAGEREIRTIQQTAADAGIALSSLATGLYWKYSLTSGDASIREKAMSVARRQLEVAAALGVDTILVVPGAVGVDFIPDAEVVPYDLAYDRALEAMHALSETAESYKVAIGIENVWNKFLLSPLELRHFIDHVNSPYVGSYLDVGNMLFAGYPEHWIRILGPRIKKVHFKDYRRAAGGLHGFVDLLAGDVNYPEVVRALEEIGYDSFVTAEMIPPYTHHGTAIIQNTSTAMDAILGRN
jgi:L-ribulose-5-phosphate 3-epimerase